jgi:hypothetical protein
MGLDPNSVHSANESVNEFHDRIVAGVSKAKAMLAKAKDEFKVYYDSWRIPALEIKVGD